MGVSRSTLHYTVIKFIVDHGFAPEVNELAELLQASEQQVEVALRDLQDGHGLVLHPNSSRIWVIHPFSLAPTNFVVRGGDKEWWGNCAWCSLGIAGLLARDVSITTTLGANGKQIEIEVKDGQFLSSDLVAHFPIPMQKAWDNVIYTCSTMLLFERESQVYEWCKKHRIAKGDVQPIRKIFEFAKAWYGNHLNPDWEKWTTAEAKTIFEKFDLSGPIWDIPVSESRF